MTTMPDCYSFSRRLRGKASWAAVVLACGLCTGSWAAERTSIDLPLDSREGSGEPNLAAGPDGTLLLSWLEPTADGASRLRHATYLDRAWSAPRTVSEGSNWFVNWADTPSVVPLSKTLWAAHWLVKSAAHRYAYDVVVALSRDGGSTWSEPLSPHTDGTPSEHGFVSLFPWDGKAGVVWLDGRKTTPGLGGPMTLRAAVMSLTEDASVASLGPGKEVDSLVCDCCQTDVAVLASGPLAVYRNRTTAEMRDIAFAELGAATSPAVATRGRIGQDGWRVKGCPVNGPTVSAAGQSIASAWFTAARAQPRVRVAWADASTRDFGDAIDVSSTRVLGRVDVTHLDNGAVAVSWLRAGADNKQGEICVRRVSPDGALGEVRVVATTSASRRSGVPQMHRVGDHLVFAWTATDGETRVRSAHLALDVL